jgi:hypothetical protein
MPALTRRRNLEAPDECWHVYYGDVQVGTIARRVGCPVDVDQWEWRRRFQRLPRDPYYGGDDD